MKILHVINGMNYGGAETLTAELARCQKARGHDVSILSLVNTAGEPREKAIAAGIPIIDVDAQSRFSLFKCLHFISCFGKDADVVHAHLYPAQLYVAFAPFLGLRIATEHNTYYRRRKHAPVRWLDRIMYRQFDTVACISSAVQDALVKLAPDSSTRLKVVENGVDLNRFAKAIKRPLEELSLPLSENAVTVACVSRLSAAKDQDTVIRAIARLPENYHLLIIGEGERRASLEDLVEVQKVADRVHFLGSRKDVPMLLKSCDAFVLSSHWEGFGLAAVEAMAAGLPVIATNVPGISEVVANQDALFEVGDDEHLSQIIKDIVNRPGFCEQLIQTGDKQATKYDIESTVSHYESIYLASQQPIIAPGYGGFR